MKRKTCITLILFIMVTAMLVSGCTVRNHQKSKRDFEIICLDGTQYWILGTWAGNISHGYMAARQKPDGTGYACGHQQSQPTDVIYPQ